MKRWTWFLVVMALVAAACGGGSDGTTSSTPPDTTAPSNDSTTTLPAPDAYPTEFDPDVEQSLVALEAANDGNWTIENALAAVELLKPIMQTGVDAYPPIDISRLMWFLSTNSESLSEDQQEILTAAPPSSATGQLVAYRFGDPVTDAWQTAVDTADSQFSSLTGSVLTMDIILAVSDLPLVGGAFTAATFTGPPTTANGYRWLFGDEETFQAMKSAFDMATDGGKIEACVIIVGGVLTGSPNRDLQSAALLHEVVHCHQHAAHPGGGAAFMASPVDWMDEGYAAWAGEFFVGGTYKSRGWWDTYHEGIGPVGGNVTNRGSYDGISFFSYLHDNGVDGWANFLNYFTNVRPSGGSGPAQFETIFGRLDTAAQARWAGTSLRRSDLGENWVYTTGPGIDASTVSRQPRQTDLFVGNQSRFSLPGGEQGTYRIQPNLGDEDAALLRLEITAPSLVRWPWGADQLATSEFIAEWCIGPECTCEDGTILGPPAPEFTESEAILATFTGGGTLTASLQTPEDECEEEEPTLSVGQCPSGIWEASPDDTKRLLTTLYTALGVADPTYEGGPVQMSFFEGGSYRFDYLKTTFNEDIDGINFRIQFTGGSFGEWEATDTELTVDVQGLDIQAQVWLDGEPAGTPRTPSGTGGGTADYICAGDTLQIDPDFEQPFWPFPRNWTLVTP